MRHRMTLSNARTGVTYELLLESDGTTWHGSWCSLDGNGNPAAIGLTGAFAHADAHHVFRHVHRLLGDADTDVMDNDWQFDEPLPPWLTE